MLPPDWELTREQISSMSYDDLSQFDVNVFMQSYREKMTKVNFIFTCSIDLLIDLDCRTTKN
jgi:hypothetical protein